MTNEYLVVYTKKDGEMLEAYPLWDWNLGPLENLEELLRYKYRFRQDIHFELEGFEMNAGTATEARDRVPQMITFKHREPGTATEAMDLARQKMTFENMKLEMNDWAAMQASNLAPEMVTTGCRASMDAMRDAILAAKKAIFELEKEKKERDEMEETRKESMKEEVEKIIEASREESGMENRKIGISSPWVSWVHKAQALFGDDPDIKIEYDNETTTVTMRVQGTDKAEALTRLLPDEINFGGVKLRVNVIPANKEIGVAEMIRNALLGNPHFSECITVQPGGCSNPFHYMMFQPEVAQYWDDNLGHPNGIVTKLYQDLAAELLGSDDPGVFYCTEQE